MAALMDALFTTGHGDWRPPGHRQLAVWPAPEDPPTEAAWQRSVQRLMDAHKSLVDAVQDMTAEELLVPPAGRTYEKHRILEGLVGHTSYHMGQIVLVRRVAGNWT